MATHILLAYTECVPGTDEAFNAWYDAVQTAVYVARGARLEAPA